MVSPFAFGWLALAVLYVISFAVTRSLLPWALAHGHQKKLSASLLQFWVFTVVTVFAYATTVAARLIELKPDAPMPPLPEIPVNLLILMGLSVVTATGSKGVTVSYLQKGDIPKEDKGSLFEDREGATDLTKAQMLIWTFIAATVYLLGFSRFVEARCYLPREARQAAGLPSEPYPCPDGFALPDIDGALLVLMGVSQGGYVAGKLVSRTVGAKVEHMLPNRTKANEAVSIYGMALGDNKEGNNIIFEDAAGGLGEVASDKISEWSETRIRFAIPPEFAPAANQPSRKYTVKVRANSQTVVAGEIEIGL